MFPFQCPNLNSFSPISSAAQSFCFFNEAWFCSYSSLAWESPRPTGKATHVAIRWWGCAAFKKTTFMPFPGWLWWGSMCPNIKKKMGESQQHAVLENTAEESFQANGNSAWLLESLESHIHIARLWESCPGELYLMALSHLFLFSKSGCIL